jgi:hypothetical protein
VSKTLSVYGFRKIVPGEIVQALVLPRPAGASKAAGSFFFADRVGMVVVHHATGMAL